MDVRQKRNKVLGERVVKALESRNMDAYYAETKEEAVKKALSGFRKEARSIWEVPLPYMNVV